MSRVAESMTLRYPADEIRRRIEGVARRLERRVGAASEILVVGVLKGSALLLADLVRTLEVPTRFEFIDVERHDDADAAGEPQIALRFFRHFQVAGRHTVVLKDVVTTGVVESYLLSQLRAQGPASLVLACVIDRPSARRTSLEVDEALFHEPVEEKWVGYGLDSGDGRFAHLPDLYVLGD